MSNSPSEALLQPGLAGPVPRDGRPVGAVRTVGLVMLSLFLGVATAWPRLYQYPLVALPWALFGAGVVLAGCLLIGEYGHDRRTGLMLIASGLLWPAGWSDPWGGIGPALTTLAGPVALVLSVWAMSRYPDPRLVFRRERLFVWSLMTWVLVGRAVMLFFGRPEWHGYDAGAWWPRIATRPEMEVVVALLELGEVILCIGFVVFWFNRARSMTGLERRLAAPVVAAGMMTGIAVMIPQVGIMLSVPPGPMMLLWGIESVLLLIVPVALITGILRGRLSQTAVAALVRGLARGVTPAQVEGALQTTLGDPDLRVYFRNRGGAGDLDVDGEAIESPPGVDDWAVSPPGSDRLLGVPALSSNGEPMAVIVTRQPIAGQHGLIDAAVAASSIALENAQLQVQLQAQLAAVRAAQIRLTEAGIRERHQMERDLHDGAQQRLLAVRMTLAAAEATQTPEVLASLLTKAREEVGEALAELRDLARGLHPPLLSQGGLAPAVTAMTERMPLPSTVDLPGRRFPPVAELTAYYVISEGLANVVRHSGADRVSIVGASDEHTLVITLSDNGRGGADLAGGSGLAGLRDRVNAIGGTLRVDSPPGKGTTMTVGLPCA